MTAKNYSLSLVIYSLGIALSSFWAAASTAQLQPPQPDLSLPKPASIDEVPGYPNQMRTWSCSKGNQSVLVEVKEVKDWSEIIANNEWICQEKLSTIPDNSPQFSCESNDPPINVITITWLTGKDGKQQMNNWIDAFQKRQMTCTIDTSNPFWN